MAVSSGADNGVKRDAQGRFTKGSKPGPGRRPVHAEALKAAQEAALTVGLPALCRAAEAGDVQAADALVRAGLPKLRPVSIVEPVPTTEDADVGQRAAEVFRAIAAGGLSTDTASTLLTALQVLAEAAQLTGLQQRLSELEERTVQGRTGVLLVPGVLDPEAWTHEAARVVDDEPKAD